MAKRRETKRQKKNIEQTNFACKAKEKLRDEASRKVFADI